MKPPERIQTERLLLRIPRLEDAESIFEIYARDPEVTRYLSWQPDERLEQTQDFLVGCIEAWRGETRFPYVISELGKASAIGLIELRRDRFKVEIGYGLGRPYWAKGYMTEAVCALVGWWKEQPDLYRLWATCDVDNLGSARVLEKVGMQLEGRLRRNTFHPNASSEPRDCFIYSIVK